MDKAAPSPSDGYDACMGPDQREWYVAEASQCYPTHLLEVEME